jgi:hypothetical protein
MSHRCFSSFFFRLQSKVGVAVKWGVQESEVVEEKQGTSKKKQNIRNEFKRKFMLQM